MSYFILKYDTNDQFEYIERSLYPEWLYDYYLAGGEIDKPFKVELFNDNNGETGDMLGGIQFFRSVSEKFRNLLTSSAKNEVCFYPVELINKVTKARTEYYYLQIKNVIKCFDWEMSKYSMVGWNNEKEDLVHWTNDSLSKMPLDTVDPSLDNIKSLVLKETEIKDFSIFRVEERTHLIIVNEALARKIISSGITGVKLVPVAEYKERGS